MIEGEWRRREVEKNNVNTAEEGLDLEQTVGEGALSNANEKSSESEEISQPIGSNSVDMSSVDSHSHATRTLLSPGGGYMW